MMPSPVAGTAAFPSKTQSNFRGASIALERHVGTADYTVRGFPAGHIGMYVSGKVQRDLPPAIADWLKARA